MWDLKEYRYAGSAAEAVALMRCGPGKGCFIAGGTDLFLTPPVGCDFVVDINGAGLDGIVRRGDGSLFLGTAATLEKISRSPLLQDYADGAVAKAAHACGNRPVRSVATVGGNLCNALPSADMAPILLALDGVAHIADEDAQTSLPLHDFFTGPRQTVLAHRLLVGLELPPRAADWGARSYKLTRTVEDISLVQVAVALEWDGSAIAMARIALGAVASVPVRARDAEELLAGLDMATVAGEEGIQSAAAAAAAAARPIDDHRASAAYRRAMVAVLTGRLLAELVAARLRETP